jgi:hypothetical protein
MKTAITVTDLIALMLNLFSGNASQVPFAEKFRDQAPVCQR